MPRRSAASLSVLPVDGGPAALKPPSSLSAEERAAFTALVDAVDRKHFRLSDLPLLSAYARAICLEARAAEELRADPLHARWLSVWEKSNRVVVALSMRLRLSPQSRQDPKSAHRERPPGGPRPWT
jgi:hypothetical protein